MITIDKDIPIPDSKKAQTPDIYSLIPWASLEIGDSFEVENSMSLLKSRAQKEFNIKLVGQRTREKSATHGQRFRLWRVA